MHTRLVNGFWSVLWSGEWLANVGLPLSLAGGALYFAYHALSTQLDSDRTLAREERRQVSADRFAHAIDSTADRLEAFATEVRAAGYQHQPIDPHLYLLRLMEPIAKATLRAMNTLGRGGAIADISTLERTARFRFAIWVALADQFEPTYGVELCRATCSHLLTEYVQLLRLTADSIEDWDGSEADLPISNARQPQLAISIDGTGSHLVPNPTLAITVIPQDEPERSARIDTERAMFELYVQQYRGVRVTHP